MKDLSLAELVVAKNIASQICRKRPTAQICFGLMSFEASTTGKKPVSQQCWAILSPPLNMTSEQIKVTERITRIFVESCAKHAGSPLDQLSRDDNFH